jgi:zinc transport system ATP-binding protein
MSNAVLCKDVSFYFGKQQILDKACFTVEQGDFVSIIGPNGGGKTTLLKLMLGLFEPTEGEIRIFDKPPKEALKKIGYMPQFSAGIHDFPVNVMDVVLMGCLGSSFFYSKKDKLKAHECLERLGITGLVNNRFSDLSGGQRQRVLMARALVSQPDILLLDEPTASLDIESEQNVYEILSELNQEMTIVLVSHDIGFVTKHVKKVVCVSKTVVMHPVSQVSGMGMDELYQSSMCMVDHNKRIS